METDLERYAWLVTYELREARLASTPEERREHEMLARAYTLKMHHLENQTFGIVDSSGEEPEQGDGERRFDTPLSPLEPQAVKRDGS